MSLWKTTMSDMNMQRAAEAFEVVLQTLRKRVSGELVAASCWNSVQEFTRGVPVDPGALFSLELHLWNPELFAEPNIPLRPGSLLTRYFGGDEAARTPGWLKNVISAGLGSDDCAGSAATLIDLEFDRDQLPPAKPSLPGVFMPASCAKATEAAARLFALTGEREATEQELANVQRAFDAFQAAPDEEVSIGVMASRTPRAFALVSQLLSPAAIPAILERLGWRGPVGQVVETLDGLDTDRYRFRVALNVTAQGVMRRLGVELSLIDELRLRLWGPGCRGWEPLIHKLASDGICLPGKAQGLLSWPGGDTLFWDSNCIRLHSGLSHFKHRVRCSSREQHARASGKGLLDHQVSSLLSRPPR